MNIFCTEFLQDLQSYPNCS